MLCLSLGDPCVRVGTGLLGGLDGGAAGPRVVEARGVLKHAPGAQAVGAREAQLASQHGPSDHAVVTDDLHKRDPGLCLGPQRLHPLGHGELVSSLLSGGQGEEVVTPRGVHGERVGVGDSDL